MTKKKNIWSNLLFFGLLVAMIIPQSRMVLQSNVQRLLMGAPKEESTYEKLSPTDLSYSIRTANGEVISLNSLNDKPVFLNYWATWCPPCVAEMPSIQNLYADYKDKVHFVLISSEEEAKTKAFLNKKGYTFPLSKAIQATPDKLSRSSIPSTFLISKNGEILVSEVGASNWNHKKFRALLDEAIKN